ncbi:PucR family transcriptional regulator [Thermoanaerobacteraceae bacterium SP2]|nr:PucR family transcriptional regulator [Thermoanaerobacteraceae bacterium SP2]
MQHGITVKEALNIGRLKEGKVVAGEKGLDRIVSYVDILEVPDAINWLRGEELLLTTGYAIKDRPDIQENLIWELAKLNAAGIIIKLNRFLKDIPEMMIEKANELNLPIIQLPADIPYIEITHTLLKEILLRQNTERWVNETLKELLNCDYNDVDKIKNKLKSINSNFPVGAPVVLAIVSYNHASDLKKFLKITELRHNSKIISGEIDGNLVIIFAVNISPVWKKEIEEILFYPNAIKEVNNDVVCIISKVIKNLSELQKEYIRLNDALKIINKLPVDKRIGYFYDDIVHYIFLNKISNSDIAKDFVEYVIGPFRNVSDKDRNILINTLYAFAKNDGNISRTSRGCFMHRNTLIYRINKLKDVLNNPLDSPEELFKYNLALTLHNLIEKL